VIVKMKFVSITGPKEDIDRVVNQYMSKYEVHLENALTQLNQIQQLSPYIQINPYKDDLAKATHFTEMLGNTSSISSEPISLEESLALIHSLDEQLASLSEECSEIETQKAALFESRKTIEPFRKLPFELSQLLHARYIHSRFGRIAKDFYNNFEKFVYEDLNALFYPCLDDGEYIWGVYFVPKNQILQVDAIFSSMHFEQLTIPDEYIGTPEQAYEQLSQQIFDLEEKIKKCRTKMTALLQKQAIKIISAKDCLDALSTNFDVRKVAACTKEQKDSFYILCGWMTEEDAASFQEEIADDINVFSHIEDVDSNPSRKPPTKLKNPKLFKPFELYIGMYGLPAYNEIDPTIFVAITYSFIFGIMFGDVGQGLCLLIGGYLLYRFKKLALAAIISSAGFFSTLFGFMFGSFFGFEDVLPALWLRPVEHMTTLPLIGQMNTVFVVAVAFGMFLILATMILNIINACKAKDSENIWFSQNAISGFIFYGSLVAVIFLFMTGHTLPGAIVLAIMFIVPLIIIMMKEPLAHLVEKKHPVIEGGVGMFLVQSFFELFEIMLSYFSNTISFVRIGAFAVSHAAMMEVVLMLAGATEGGSPNWLVIVLGNIFVCAMEGLIVGIQVLRLEYYELFSRFYKGDGKAFKPFLKKNC
jgi:V/A-type H+-transporting ATPase subunit I